MIHPKTNAGSGKSLCFQLPAVMGNGIVVCISPLIALMRDQCHQLGQYTTTHTLTLHPPAPDTYAGLFLCMRKLTQNRDKCNSHVHTALQRGSASVHASLDPLSKTALCKAVRWLENTRCICPSLKAIFNNVSHAIETAYKRRMFDGCILNMQVHRARGKNIHA
jgi:hypothetical protein